MEGVSSYKSEMARAAVAMIPEETISANTTSTSAAPPSRQAPLRSSDSMRSEMARVAAATAPTDITSTGSSSPKLAPSHSNSTQSEVATVLTTAAAISTAPPRLKSPRSDLMRPVSSSTRSSFGKSSGGSLYSRIVEPLYNSEVTPNTIPNASKETASASVISTSKGTPRLAPLRSESMRSGHSLFGDHSRSQLNEVILKIQEVQTREGKGSELVCWDGSDDDEVVRFLLSERVYGYPTSNGSMSSNYWHYVKNNHPLLSIFMCARLNPYTKRMRAIVYLSIACFAMGLSYILWKTHYIDQISICREGCHVSYHNSTAPFCDGGYNDRMSYDAFKSECRYFQPWFLSLICGSIIVPYGYILQFCGTCGCVRGRQVYRTGSCGRICTRAVDFFGGATLTLISVGSIVLLGWAVVACSISGDSFDIFLVFVEGKIFSFFEWFLFSLPYFSWRYKIDKTHFYRKLGSRSIIDIRHTLST